MLSTWQANGSERRGVEARNTILFRKPADQEDGRLMFQNNHLFGVWMPGSFMDQRWQGGGNKVKRPLILQISPRMASLRRGAILFSRFWIIFTTIIWNSLSGRFSISSSFVWFGGHLSCYFTCWVFLCLFILFILLCLGWPFCILAVCGILFIAAFPHCGWGCMGGLSRFPG